MKTSDIAVLFVDLALKHNWDKVNELPAREVKILFEIVSAAGFEPMKIVPGKLFGYYRDQDGSRTGETYPINSLCPYKVISQDGYDHCHATGWLDGALQLVQNLKDRQKLVKEIQQEIARSIPLKPIQLTLDGDLLREIPPSGNYFVNHTRDGHELSCCVGVHAYCDGWMDRTGATKKDDAIVCRNCHLRVIFPKDIKTYGELRQAMESRLALITAILP